MEEQFLEKIVQFLKEVAWLYDFPVTQVFTRNVLSQIPEEWCASFVQISLDSLNGIPECNSQLYWPSSLKDFLEKCKDLSLQKWINNFQPEYIKRKSPQNLRLPKELCKGMSSKKKHEVTSMVQFVKELGDITKSSRILDIGSGLGYVDSALHHILGATVVGAESEDCRVVNAQKRQNMLTGSCEGIKYINWLLHDDQVTLDKAQAITHRLTDSNTLCTCRVKSERFENNFAEEESKGISEPNAKVRESVMLIGLHSCADLSPIMMEIFKQCSDISSVVLFSCCYHKLKTLHIVENCAESKSEKCGKCEGPECLCSMNITSDCVDIGNESIKPVNLSNFKNFPMSHTLKKIMKTNDFHLSVYGLRLAAQESGVRWLQHTEEDHKNHERNVAYRAVLEAFCQKEGMILKKCRRRCVRKSNFCNFSQYLTAIFESYEFIPNKNQNSNCHGSTCKSSVDKCLSETEMKSSHLVLKENSFLSITKDCEVSMALPEKNSVSKEYIREKLTACFTEFEDMFYLVEPLTGLQLALQPVLEALVLLDRLTYLKEAKFEKVWLKEVFNVAVSPRNVALIAVK